MTDFLHDSISVFKGFQKPKNGYTQKKNLLHPKTKVVGHHLLCGENTGQSGQRGLEVGFSEPKLF